MGYFSSVDLLVVTSLDHLLFILKLLFTLFIKPAILITRTTVLNLINGCSSFFSGSIDVCGCSVFLEIYDVTWVHCHEAEAVEVAAGSDPFPPPSGGRGLCSQAKLKSTSGSEKKINYSFFMLLVSSLASVPNISKYITVIVTDHM
jgi:hypothetical protein